MTAAPIVNTTLNAHAHTAHSAHPGSIPARRPVRPFVPAPVQSGVVQKPAADAEQLTVADAVLELLRSVNRNASRQ